MAAASLELFTSQIHLHTLPMMLMHDGCMRSVGELNLRCDRTGLQILVALQIEQRVLAMDPVELLGDIRHNYVVPIFSTETVITVGGNDIQPVTFDSHDRDVERAAAEI